MTIDQHIFLCLTALACLFSLFECVSLMCNVSKLEKRVEKLDSMYSSINARLKKIEKGFKYES